MERLVALINVSAVHRVANVAAGDTFLSDLKVQIEQGGFEF